MIELDFEHILIVSRPPRTPPRVQFQTSRFATRVDFFAFVTPALPAERKAGMVEGPLMAIQCRHEDYFVYPGGPQCREDSPPAPESLEEEEVGTSEEAKFPVPDNEGDTPMKEDTSTAISDKEVPEATAEESEAAEAAQKKEEARLAKIEEARRRAAKREEEKKIRIKKGSWPEGDVWDVLKEVGALLCTAQERRKGGKGADGIGKGKVEKKTRYRAIGRESSWWDDVSLPYFLGGFYHKLYTDQLPKYRFSSSLRFTVIYHSPTFICRHHISVSWKQEVCPTRIMN